MILFDAVDVYLDEGPGAPVPVGHLRATFSGRGRLLNGSNFEYTADYLASRAAYAISPDLPLAAGKQFSGEDAALFGAFADVTPDDWGTGLIDAAFARERAGASGLASSTPSSSTQSLVLGAFDHLVQQNDLTRMGALRFTASGMKTRTAAAAEAVNQAWLTAAQHTAANPNDARRIAEAVARFEEYEATDEDLEILGYTGSSLGGARPKATIQETDGSLWLLKLPSSRDRRTDTEAWEATMLDMAASAGLRVPRHRLIRLDDHKSSLLIERFDRRDTAVASTGFDQKRVGYMSALTAMQLGPQRSATYEDFADTIDQVTLAASAEDLREMFGRVALTVLVGSVDDHWKNHGFIRKSTPAGTAWRLSPLFDVNPTRSGSRVHSRQINSRDDASDRDVRRLIEGRDVYRLTQRDAAEVLSRVTGAVDIWRETAKKNNISAGEIEHMASAFNETQLEHAQRFVAKHLDARVPTPATAERIRRFPELRDMRLDPHGLNGPRDESPDAGSDLQP
jgi:serine/threonine-protein kinase HipA